MRERPQTWVCLGGQLTATTGTADGRRVTESRVVAADVTAPVEEGDTTGVIGTLDIIWLQVFNGPRPRWRLYLDWDSGPAVLPVSFEAQCRRHVADGPDPVCGTAEFLPGPVDANSQREVFPDTDRSVSIEDRLRGGRLTRYHDDLSGTFEVEGYPYPFEAGTLHTGRWHRCGNPVGCRYYQVPWESDPDAGLNG